MSRPPVTVVMPFAGDEPAARRALASLDRLAVRPDDELILVDNAGTAPAHDRVVVVRAAGERSPAHARNAGAERARREWILFLDADCDPRPDLLDAFFAQPVAADVAVLAGEVVPARPESVAARYGAARGFLGQAAHLAHPYLPRAVAANLLVRREVFEELGGFFEGVRAAEDTDFCWRVQQAGWWLELRPAATVRHAYRTTVRDLRRQWRGYAAGRAWLHRRYEGFVPEPAVRRAAARLLARLPGRRRARSGRRRATPGPRRAIPARRDAATRLSTLERGRFIALDALLAGEELAGLALSNRPARAERARGEDGTRVVLVADRFPARGDPLVDFALSVGGARVEAGARPAAPERGAVREVEVFYREDEGLVARMQALLELAARHPWRTLRAIVSRRAGAPALAAIAPAVLRLEREPGARVHPLGGGAAQATARRLSELAGRAVDDPSSG